MRLIADLALEKRETARSGQRHPVELGREVIAQASSNLDPIQRWNHAIPEIRRLVSSGLTPRMITRVIRRSDDQRRPSWRARSTA